MIDKSSCQPREPFIKLGAGVAPGLNYNLPQKTAFSVYGRIRQVFPPVGFRTSRGTNRRTIGGRDTPMYRSNRSSGT